MVAYVQYDRCTTPLNIDAAYDKIAAQCDESLVDTSHYSLNT